MRIRILEAMPWQWGTLEPGQEIELRRPDALPLIAEGRAEAVTVAAPEVTVIEPPERAVQPRPKLRHAATRRKRGRRR